MNKNIRFISFLLVCSLFISVSFVHGASKKAAKSKEIKKPVVVEKLKAKLTDLELREWMTYRSEKNGFEIKYPSDIAYRESQNITAGNLICSVSFGKQLNQLSAPRAFVLIFITDSSPEKWIKTQYRKKSSDPKKPGGYGEFKYVEIEGKKFLNCFLAGPSGGSNSFLFKKDEKTLFDIGAYSGSKGEFDKDTFEKMVSTFKFTDINPAVSTSSEDRSAGEQEK
jgi:hypothetical protein